MLRALLKIVNDLSVHKITRACLGLLLYASPLMALDQEIPKQVLLLDRVAVALTGKPAPNALKTAIKRGAPLGEVIENFRSSSDFEKRFAEYWLQVLKITKPVNWTKISRPIKAAGIYNENDQRTLEGLFFTANNRLSFYKRADYCPQATGDRFVYYLDNIVTIPSPSIDDKTNYAYGACGCLLNRGLRERTDAAGNVVKYCPAENCANIVEISPYWAPDTKVRVCRGLVQDITYVDPDAAGATVTEPAKCGADLSRCWIFEEIGFAHLDQNNNYIKNITYAFTMEPGILLSRIVQENRSWDEALTTTKGYVNGSLGHLLGPNPGNANRYRDAFMTFAPKTATTLSYPGSLSFNFDPMEWQRFYEVEKGNVGNSGVLTTLAFQRTTNGWRAKANRTMEAFLCRQFKVPEDAEQPPNDETDLTKKPYCKHCHAVLEPMAQFFAHWPNLGEANYFYNEQVRNAPDLAKPMAINALGSFDGQDGADVMGLAGIMVGMRAYNECAVRRAFDFLVGRSLTVAEEENILGPLTDKFEREGKRLWPVITEILQSPAFRGGR